MYLSYPCTVCAARVSPVCAVQDLDAQDKGYMIKSGIVVIMRNATIKDGTVI